MCNFSMNWILQYHLIRTRVGLPHFSKYFNALTNSKVMSHHIKNCPISQMGKILKTFWTF